MRIFVFGDSNVDVTVSWSEVEKNLGKLSEKNKKLISNNIKKSKEQKTDIEYYLTKQDPELSDFFASLNPRVEFGGCGAIKARTMAKLGHEVVFFSWVGDDARGQMILDELQAAGVNTKDILVSGKTSETFNLFDPDQNRLAFSFWKQKLVFDRFVSELRTQKPDKVFLTGAHRIKSSLAYASLARAYVFSGSFVPYSRAELNDKYKGDFSTGIIVGNETEIMALANANNPVAALKKLKNEIVVLHSGQVNMVKRGEEIITSDVPPIDRSKVIELTGIGDVWESFFLGSINDLKTASEKDIKSSMELATRAAMHRMLTGEFPTI